MFLRHVFRHSTRFLYPRYLHYSAMPALKQGEFVGSLDCGTTYVAPHLAAASTPYVFCVFQVITIPHLRQVRRHSSGVPD